MVAEITKLKPSVVEEVKKNLNIKNRLQYEMRISYDTIMRWLRSNSDQLTKAHALRILSEELGVDQSELLQN